MSSEGLERLDAWRKARDFALLVYRQAIPAWPVEEKWGLASQLRRASQSIPANLAEGYGRFYYQETIRFAYIARGSLNETISHLLLASKLGYLDGKVATDLVKRGNDLDRLICGYVAYLKKSRHGEKEPGASVTIAEASVYYDSNPDDFPGEADDASQS